MVQSWFEEISKSRSLTQGDIIIKCQIPVLSQNVFETIIGNGEEQTKNVDVLEADVVVLSQACDIANNKIDSIILCPVWPLTTLMENNNYYNSSNGKESLRQGKEPSYHLLNDCSTEKIKLPLSVVDFHRIYSLPKTYIEGILENIDFRLRLLSPYREHLSQAFARYFMRVGLPLDIDKEKVESLSV